MSTVNWTKPQQEAIQSTGSSVIVSAAAGSGKTAVLVERIIRKLETTDIDRLLIVTFTKAAAAQMREGITKAIEETLLLDLLPQQAAHYQKQLILLPSAQITTIDSFCNSIVRNYFDKLDLSPDFSIAEPGQADLLLDEAVNELLEQQYEEGAPAFLDFANCYAASKNDSALAAMVKRVHHFTQSVPFPDRWLSMVRENYTTQLDQCAWVQELLEQTREVLFEAASMVQAATAYVSAQNDCETALSMLHADQELVTCLEQACTCYKAVYEQLKVMKYATFSKKNLAPEHVIYLEHYRKQYKDLLGGLEKQIFRFSPEELEAFLSRQRPHVETLCSLVQLADERFMQKKQEKNLVTFSDLEHFSITLLTEVDGSPSAIARTLSQEFDELVVDEYQDTNEVQETIFRAISKNESNLFMVGDMKQSIYRFRNTAPELFLNKVESFHDQDHPGGKRIFLSQNFRSRRSVLDFANLVFSQLMSKKTGQVSYTEKEMLHAGAQYPPFEESTEVILLRDDKLFDGDQLVPVIKKEAAVIAQKIQHMIESGFQVQDKKTKVLRPVTYHDFAILLRNAKGAAGDLAEYLEQCGIPVYYDDSGFDMLASMETQTVLSFLKIIDNPRQDIPLAAVLRSPLFGFSDDLLAQIRIASPHTGYYQALAAYCQGDSPDAFKAQAFLDTLETYRAASVYTPICDLIEQILADTGYLDYASALEGGQQRRANLSFLIETARSFENGVFKGLFQFLRYVDQFAPAAQSLSSPKILPETANVVQITTIHKSKGLEYPVVILPQLGRQFKNLDNREQLTLHKSMGLGFDYKNPNQHMKIASPLRQAILHKLSNESLSEELRVLYVALTRAKEKTILIGSMPDEDKFRERVALALNAKTTLLPPHLIIQAKSYLEWICLSLVRHPCFQHVWDPLPRPQCPVATKSDILVRYSVTPYLALGTQRTPEPEEPPEPVPVSDAVRQKLEYQYPYFTGLFAKFSVTELKRMLTEDENAKPYFQPLLPLQKRQSESNAPSAAERGTLIHFVMEQLDFKTVRTKGDIQNLLQTLAEKNLISEEEIALVPIDKLASFCNNDLGKRLRESKEIHKETPFNILIDGSVIDPAAAGEKTQLQGVIDCYFKEGDTYVIVDYKTDRMTPENTQQKIQDYKVQIEFYRQAVEAMHPGTKTCGYLYFFDADLTVLV